jgi:hypothetical protein
MVLTVGAVLALSAGCSDPKQPENGGAQKPASEAVAPAPAVTPERKVTPIRDGVGVAGIELGMTPATVEAKLGKPLRTNKAGDQVLYMAFGPGERFGVYFDDKGVRMLIASVQDGTWCTDYDVCLYREGDLAKLKARHGAKMLRFVDRDGGIMYRLLEPRGDRKVMTEYTPVEERNGVVQVAILYWSGNIDTSGFD